MGINRVVVMESGKVISYFLIISEWHPCNKIFTTQPEQIEVLWYSIQIYSLTWEIHQSIKLFSALFSLSHKIWEELLP